MEKKTKKEIRMAKEIRHKATIETVVNTIALALTSFGVLKITQATGDDWRGYTAICFAVFLEYFKYWGRHKKLW